MGLWREEEVETIDYTMILEDILAGVEMMQASIEKSINVGVSMFLILFLLILFRE